MRSESLRLIVGALAGRVGISRLCDGSSWRCITKCDALGWFGLARFCTAVRVSKEEHMMFESSSESRQSWNGRKMIWHCISDV